MIPLFNQEEFQKSKHKDKLPCKCYYCQNIFYATRHQIVQSKNKNSHTNLKYCSIDCSNKALSKKELVNCKQCNKSFLKQLNQIKNSPNHFCCRSCSGTYNSLHKSHGTRRSKLEVWLEQELPALYPELEFHFNRKDTINSELDIYIPNLKLAFELNGVFHYEPIFGDKKLDQIQNNDNRKFQACGEKGISLCIIDVSALSYFKPDKAKKYLEIIMNIINNGTSGGI